MNNNNNKSVFNNERSKICFVCVEFRVLTFIGGGEKRVIIIPIRERN